MLLDFQQKNKLRNLLFSKFFLVLLFIVFIFLAYSTFSVYLKMKESSDKKQKVINEMIVLEEKNRLLENKINELNSPSGIEREIRDKFAVAKNGEKVVVIVEDKESTSTEVYKEKTTWQKVLEFFGFAD